MKPNTSTKDEKEMLKDDNYYNSLDKRSKEYKQWKLSKQTFTEDVGLGDVVETIAKKTGIKKIVQKLTKDCGCDERKKQWNKISLFKKGLKPRCFTEEEAKQWKDFMEVRTLRITNEQRIFIANLFSTVFNRPYYEPCVNCSPKPLISMIDNLDKVYNNK